MPLTIRPLQTEDDRSDFRSGNIELDRFFQRYAGQNQFKHHIGTTYIAVENDVIVGFATVAASQLEIEHLPPQRRKRLPRYPLPVLMFEEDDKGSIEPGKLADLVILSRVGVRVVARCPDTPSPLRQAQDKLREGSRMREN